MDRRQFFRWAAAGGAGVVAGGWAGHAVGAETAGKPVATTAAGAAAATAKSRVVVVRHPNVLRRGYEVDRTIFAEMIERGIRELTGADSAAKAWGAIATDGDRVTMKYNTVGGRNLQTHPELYEILTERLKAEAGVGEINAWDRGRLPDGKDGWGSETYTLPSREIRTRLRAIVTDWATCLINLPVVKMHWGTGITIALKNHMGTNDNPADLHNWGDGMGKSIAELNALDPIRSKTRLVVCDGTRPLWDGGPGDRPPNRWNENALLFSLDPVAADAVGLEILEKKRAEVKGEPWPATHGRTKLEHAEKIGLGVADRARIDVEEIKLG